jgi:hypothetical protein
VRHNEANRRLGHPAARRTPDDTIAKGTDDSIADRGDGADPREVGELLSVWLSIKVDEVDLAVETARDKMATIPDWRVLSTLLGELTIRVHALELEVEDLKRGRR